MSLKSFISCLLLLTFLFLSGYTAQMQTLQAHQEVENQERLLQIGVLLARDSSQGYFSEDVTYKALETTRQSYDFRYEVLTLPQGKAPQEFTVDQYDLIIGMGQENAPAIRSMAADYPDRLFAVVDAPVAGANIASIVYRVEEADFLMGALAAMISEKGRVGFIGGVNSPGTERIKGSFMQGAHYWDSKIEVRTGSTGTSTDAGKAEALATDFFWEGVDIIYHAAGQSGTGVIKAAIVYDGTVMGADRNEMHLGPNHVAGNRIKRADTALTLLISELARDNFNPGIRSLGLKESALSLGPINKRIVPDDVIDQLKILEDRIIAGEIDVHP